MGLQRASLFADPPPDFAFEISEAGIAFTRPNSGAGVSFEPLEKDVIAVTPLRDNVLRPDMLSAKINALVNTNGTRKRRRAALILPDFCARIAVLEFDAFPDKPEEQMSLVRFRVKKSVPFDVESAAVSYYAQAASAGVKRVYVLVVAAPIEIVAPYEAPFRLAGLQTGLVTTSGMAAYNLLNIAGVSVMVKISGKVLTVTVTQGGVIKLVRCVELTAVNHEEMMGILFPTVAYVEDELAVRPEKLLVCGFGAAAEQFRTQWETELGIAVEPLGSRLGTPGPYNAGLLGYLESLGAGR
ncbi:MAG TPA: hypothetical protein VMZ52_02910 [Bryobacteraceae bacterium]|nr:hypothetical protein [Bryobacteraceae bacterium]